MQKFEILLYIFLVLLIASCLEDIPSLVVHTDLGNGAVVLRYLESQGDFINTRELPGTIDAEEVKTNLENFLILDIRDSVHFKSGHIPGAISIHHSKLDDIIEENIGTYDKMVIASYTGQSACFYTTLLRYLGYSNVFSLKFGMASWHRDFANYWIDVIQNNYKIKLQNDPAYKHPKPEFSHLPEINLGDNNSDSTIIIRIKKLFNQPYDDIWKSYYESPFVTGIVDNTAPLEKASDKLIICYSPAQIYYSQKYSMQGIIVPMGVEQSHIENAVQYLSFPGYELRSHYYLQTLPSKKPIEIYSSNGFESACATAYLRILGYNVKSILFGASCFNYYNMTFFPESEEYLFTNDDIKNYGYVND